MVETCTQNGHQEEAQELFHQMQAEGIEPNLTSWNSIAAVCVEYGQGADALKLFCQMQQLVSMRPNSTTVATILPVCPLKQGKEIHGYIFRSGVRTTGLVGMYAKCGHVEFARRVFEKALERDTVAWNSMIGAYAMHGSGDKALELSYEMQLAGLKPNNATFAGVLSGCNKADMVDEGWYLFKSMDQEYQIKPDADHCATVVDLFSRAGRFSEVNDLMNKTAIEAVAIAYGAYIAARGVHGNMEVGAWNVCVSWRLKLSKLCTTLKHLCCVLWRWDEAFNVRSTAAPHGKLEIAVCLRERRWPEQQHPYPQPYGTRDYAPPSAPAPAPGPYQQYPYSENPPPPQQYPYGYGSNHPPQQYPYGSANPPSGYPSGPYGNNPYPERAPGGSSGYGSGPAYGESQKPKSSKFGVGTGLAVGAVAGVLGGLNIAEGADYVEDKIAEDAAEKVEDDYADQGAQNFHRLESLEGGT